MDYLTFKLRSGLFQWTVCFFRHESQHLHLPWDLEDAKHLGLVLDRYKDKYFYEVLFGVFLVYILYPFENKYNFSTKLVDLVSQICDWWPRGLVFDSGVRPKCCGVVSYKKFLLRALSMEVWWCFMTVPQRAYWATNWQLVQLSNTVCILNCGGLMAVTLWKN